ncbi:hypothetical protein PVL29_018985 [Vitis rotundifolia]|uniref:Uncharacterized protein n=1 Tax=Vitis rotundifolia TaxID=103349 RepID=A0AA39DGJ0_VITRO|nr:hypothetical protein PVL29_018985 [Vitis rotundifolia]
MAEHPKIDLTMVRLLQDGKVTDEDGSERKLDNELVCEFRVITAGNHRVMYIEEVVVDGSGTVAVIRSMENSYELLIVGRPRDEQFPLTAGLTDWNQHSNLGIIGEMLASTDFKSNTAILVVQQHAHIANEWGGEPDKKL